MPKPTRSETILWQFAAIYLTSLPIAAGLVLIMGLSFDNSYGYSVVWLPLAVGIFIRPLVRAIAVIDALALLRQLLDTAYRELA